MTKKDIILKVSDATNLKQIDVKKVVQRTLDYIIESLAQGSTVELRNFGVFDVRIRKPRKARNPRTGVPCVVPERKVVHFKAGAIMKGRVTAKGQRLNRTTPPPTASTQRSS